MTIEQINNLEIESVIYTILSRLDLGEDIYVDVEVEGTLHDKLTLTEKGITDNIVIPALAALEAEFEDYKAELIVAENARLAEVARVADLESRYSVISMRDAGMPAFYALKTDVPNAHLYLHNLLHDADKAVEAEAFMVELEAKDLELVSAQNILDARQAKMDIGKIVRAKTNAALEMITGHNLLSGFTAEQIDTMQSTFAAIETALKDGRPDTAKILIEAITPDGTIVTQELKDDIISVL